MRPQEFNACRRVNASAAKACHAEDISTYGVRIATRMGQCKMTHWTVDDNQKQDKVMREDLRRKLHMTASDPSENKGKIDRRVFYIELKRPDINLPEGEVEKLRWAQASEDRDEKLRRLQETLKEFISTGTKLGHLLQRDN